MEMLEKFFLESLVTDHGWTFPRTRVCWKGSRRHSSRKPSRITQWKSGKYVRKHIFFKGLWIMWEHRNTSTKITWYSILIMRMAIMWTVWYQYEAPYWNYTWQSMENVMKVCHKMHSVWKQAEEKNKTFHWCKLSVNLCFCYITCNRYSLPLSPNQLRHLVRDNMR